jgi:hypothetical protein
MTPRRPLVGAVGGCLMDRANGVPVSNGPGRLLKKIHWQD